MPPDSTANPAITEAIANYEIARDARNRARIFVSAIVMLIVIIFILMGMSEFNNFTQNRTDEFAEAMTAEAADMAPLVVDHLNNAVNRLIPIYTESFYDTMEANQERFSAVLVEEYLGLQKHAHESWPEIEMAIAQLVVEQENTAREKLAAHVSDDAIIAMSDAYHVALTEYLDLFFQEHFGDKMIVAQNIVDKLQSVADSEPNMAPGDSQFVLGMIIELLGMQMQINSAGPESINH